MYLDDMILKKYGLIILICSFGYMTKVSAQYLHKEPAVNDSMKPEDTEFYEPKPSEVSPGKSANAAPSDATVLFDGSNLDKWENEDGGAAEWKVEGDHFTVEPGKGDIQTKESFGDVQLHIEWRTPSPAKGSGQDRGNSGVFLQSQYEIQVLDSYKSKTYTNGQAGALYKDFTPLVNVSKKPGKWQSYDIIYHAPVFEDSGEVKYPATFTVFQNGVLIQDHISIKGETLYIGRHYYKKHGELPLKLQDHGDKVSYRNIWIRPL